MQAIEEELSIITANKVAHKKRSDKKTANKKREANKKANFCEVGERKTRRKWKIM